MGALAGEHHPALGRVLCNAPRMPSCPGQATLGIGKAWMRAVSKLILLQCGRDGKAACGNTQLCTGLEAGIEGTIHASIRCATADDTLQFPEDDSPMTPRPTTHLTT